MIFTLINKYCNNEVLSKDELQKLCEHLPNVKYEHAKSHIINGSKYNGILDQKEVDIEKTGVYNGKL